MRSVITITVLIGVAYAAPKRLAPVEPATGPVIEDEYIVIFNEHATDELVESHYHKLSTIMAQYNSTQRVMNRYHIGSFRGYSAHFNDKTLETVREELIVEYIEHNQVVKAYECVEQSDATWGLVRTSQEEKYDSNKPIYKYSANGEGVDVYIIDTGIYRSHSDFGGRAKEGKDFTGKGDTDDGNGHGTHIAGTIVGEKYGLAKKATAIAVKVLGENGSGSTDGVISGIEYVANEHTKSPTKKSVANMSLGGGKSTALNDAVTEAISKGVHLILAAGNSNQNGCNYSPGSTPNAVTVASSDSADRFSASSNYGECVDIIAPGIEITSAWITGPNSFSTISGTSMAAPHVAGVMAKLLSNSDFTPAQMKTKLTNELALEEKITIVDKPGQVNKLLNNQC